MGRVTKWLKANGSTLPVLVSVAALVVAGLSYDISRGVREEQQTVALEIDAAANIRDFTNEGYGLRVTLLNASLRPIIVKRAQLLMNGHLVAEASGYLNDTRVLDRYMIEPGRVTDRRRELPVAMGAREGKTVARLMDFRYFKAGAKEDPDSWKRQNRAERRFEKNLIFLPTGENKDRLQLLLELLPGGTRTDDVRGIPGMTARFAWQQSFARTPGGTYGLEIRRKLGATGQADRIRLEVWSRHG
ncbi:hypothetical protein LCGC14_2788430, partial [marine sediment metagenome]